MSLIKVETDELIACAKRYKDLADSFNNACETIIAKMGEYDDVWKGSFTQDFEKKVESFNTAQNGVYENCIKLVDFINGAVEKYIKWDTGVIPKDETYGSADYPSNVDVSGTIINYGGNTYSCVNGYDPNQYNYYQYAEEYGGRYGRYQYGCSLCAMATCISIALGRRITPDDLCNQGYWGAGGVTNWSYSQKACSLKYNSGLGDIYNSIKSKHPCILKFEGNGTGTHYIAAVGIREGADSNHLTMSDILVADPANPGVTRTLQEAADFQYAYGKRHLTGFMASY